MNQSQKPLVGMGVEPRAPESAYDRSVRERMAIERETRRLGELRQTVTGEGPVWGIFGLVNRLWRWGMASPLPAAPASIHPVLRKAARSG